MVHAGLSLAILALSVAQGAASADIEPWAYQYFVGGLVFVVGLFLALRSGQLDLSQPGGRRWLVIFILGFVAYAVLQGAMQFWLPRW